MTELEKAAREYASCEVSEGELTGLRGIEAGKMEPFIAGADWQSKQSPWIYCNNYLPSENQMVIIQAGYKQNIIHLVTYRNEEFYKDGKFVPFVKCWMPIPIVEE